jgi:hypothetical protein
MFLCTKRTDIAEKYVCVELKTCASQISYFYNKLALYTSATF